MKSRLLISIETHAMMSSLLIDVLIDINYEITPPDIYRDTGYEVKPSDASLFRNEFDEFNASAARMNLLERVEVKR